MWLAFPTRRAATRLHFKTSSAQALDIAIAGASHFLDQFVENAEITGKTRGIIAGVERDVTGEMVFFAPIGDEDGQNLFLSSGERHWCKARAAHHAR